MLRAIHIAAAIIAKVEDDALQMLVAHLFERVVQLLVRVIIERCNGDLADVVRQHIERHGGYSDFLPNDGDIYRSGRAGAADRQADGVPSAPESPSSDLLSLGS